MTKIDKLNAVIEFLEGKLDFPINVYKYGHPTVMLDEVKKQLREEKAGRTVVENLRSHKELGSFRGEWAIKCGGLIWTVKAGDVIVDYEDGERKILGNAQK